MLSPGKGSGVAVQRNLPPATASGTVYDPFQKSSDAGATAGGNSAPKTLSELRKQRRAAMRADPSFDIDGDGIVDQKGV